MAPIPSLNNDTPRLQERAHFYTKEDRENAGWVALGIICAAAFFAIMYIIVKKYGEKWGEKAKALKHTYTNWKASKALKEPKKPEPAHVANTHSAVSETPSIDSITESLTPGYMKMTTSTLHG